MVKVNGQSLFYFKKDIPEKYGEDFWKELIAGTSEEVQEIWSNPILASQFYDNSAEVELIESFVKLKGEEELVKLAEHDAKKQLSGIFGFVIQFITVKKILSKMQSMWDKDYDQGKIELIEASDGYYRVKVSDFPLTDNFRIYLENYFRTIAELASKKKVYSKSIVKKDCNEFILSFEEI